MGIPAATGIPTATAATGTATGTRMSTGITPRSARYLAVLVVRVCVCVCVCVCVGGWDFVLALQNSRVIRALACWGYLWPHLLHAVGFGRLGERAIFRSSCKVTGDVIDGTRCFTATEQDVTQQGSQSNLMKSTEAQDLDIHFSYCSLAGSGAPLIPAFVRQPSWGNVLPVPEEDTPNAGETSTCDQPSKTAILYLLVTMSSFNQGGSHVTCLTSHERQQTRAAAHAAWGGGGLKGLLPRSQ